jgi:copper chaperone CopZ
VDRVEVDITDRSVDIAFDGDSGTYAAIVEAIEDQGYEVAASR